MAAGNRARRDSYPKIKLARRLFTTVITGSTYLSVNHASFPYRTPNTQKSTTKNVSACIFKKWSTYKLERLRMATLPKQSFKSSSPFKKGPLTERLLMRNQTLLYLSVYILC